jgi:hypothetical protein
MEVIAIQDWLRKPMPLQSPATTAQHKRRDDSKRRGTRAGDSKNRRHQSYTVTQSLPQARPSQANLQLLYALQRLYQLYQQLESSISSPRHQHHIAELRADISESRGRLLAETSGHEQQLLLNQYGLRPITMERLRLITAQIIEMQCQL